MVKDLPHLLNSSVSANNFARGFLCPNQDPIPQEREIALHDREAHRFDDFPRSERVGIAASDLQTVLCILQENVLTRPLVGDDAPDPNSQFFGLVPVILKDAS